MMMRTLTTMAWVLALGACGAEEDVTNPPGTTLGFTTCGSNTCQPGQYCEDATFSLCEPGCTSDVNCAQNQSCVEPDLRNIGTCRNAGTVCGNGICEAGETNCPTDCGPAITQEQFCDKALLCDPYGTPEMCATLYAGTNNTCHQCIVDGNCGDINNGSCDTACGGGGGGGTCPGVRVNLIDCDYDSDCGDGNHCENGECFDGSWNQPCSYDSDCDSVCTNGCCQ